MVSGPGAIIIGKKRPIVYLNLSSTQDVEIIVDVQFKQIESKQVTRKTDNNRKK